MIGNWLVDWFTCIEMAIEMIGNDLFESLGRSTICFLRRHPSLVKNKGFSSEFVFLLIVPVVLNFGIYLTITEEDSCKLDKF